MATGLLLAYFCRGLRWQSASLRLAIALWAIPFAMVSALCEYNYLVGQPHNGDRALLLLAAVATCWYPSLIFVVITYGSLMSVQFAGTIPMSLV